MPGLSTVLMRTVAYLAVSVYALLPGVSLAQCGCPDCACVTEQGVENCCCSTLTKLPTCCNAPLDACGSCGPASQPSEMVSCVCEQHFSGHQPVPQTKRSETHEDQAAQSFEAIPVFVLAHPQSEPAVSVAELDPLAHTPPIHLLNCVWRN